MNQRADLETSVAFYHNGRVRLRSYIAMWDTTVYLLVGKPVGGRRPSCRIMLISSRVA